MKRLLVLAVVTTLSGCVAEGQPIPREVYEDAIEVCEPHGGVNDLKDFHSLGNSSRGLVVKYSARCEDGYTEISRRIIIIQSNADMPIERTK